MRLLHLFLSIPCFIPYSYKIHMLKKDLPLGADNKELAFVRSTGQVYFKLCGRIS